MPMRAWPILVSICLISMPAQAAEKTTYGWCERREPTDIYRMSGLMQKSPSTSTVDIENAFRASLGTEESVTCWFYYSSPSEGEDYFNRRQYVITTEEKRQFTVTGWTGPYAITGKPAPKPAGAALTVEAAPVAQPNAEAAARAAIIAQRREVDARVGAAARAAQADAEYQAKLSKFFEELRRRGRAQ